MESSQVNFVQNHTKEEGKPHQAENWISNLSSFLWKMHNADSTDGTNSILIKTNELELDTQLFNEQNVFLFSHPF